MVDKPKLKPSDYVRKGWCQGTMARDAQGKYCPEYSSDAIPWCVYGAVYVTYSEDQLRRERILDMLQSFHIRLSSWNDDPKRTQAEVIALLESIGE